MLSENQGYLCNLKILFGYYLKDYWEPSHCCCKQSLMFMQKPFACLAVSWEKYQGWFLFKTPRYPPHPVKSVWCGCFTWAALLPWEWSYPGEYFWYRSLQADICGLYSLSQQTLLNSDLQNQAEGERMTLGELCFLSGDSRFAQSAQCDSLLM